MIEYLIECADVESFIEESRTGWGGSLDDDHGFGYGWSDGNGDGVCDYDRWCEGDDYDGNGRGSSDDDNNQRKETK